MATIQYDDLVESIAAGLQFISDELPHTKPEPRATRLGLPNSVDLAIALKPEPGS